MVKGTKKPTVLEWAAWSAGSALLIAYATAEWHFARSHQAGLREFAAARQQARQPALKSVSTTPDASAVAAVRSPGDVHSPAADVPGLQVESERLLGAPAPNMTAWSAGRIAAYYSEDRSAEPQAVLRIPSIDLEVPVYAGVTDTNLNRGAAWIDGTAPLGEPGNTGLAAHRDGYFRALRGVAVGDRIELQTLLESRVYTVDEIRVVEPQEVQVLAPSQEERLTLVTCYPFYMVGPAPKRFVVRARAASAQESS